MDPKVAKISLLYKLIVKAMKPNETNLQFMPRYQLARFNPYRGRSWGLAWNTLPANNTNDSRGPRYETTLVRHGR